MTFFLTMALVTFVNSGPCQCIWHLNHSIAQDQWELHDLDYNSILTSAFSSDCFLSLFNPHNSDMVRVQV